MTQPLGSTAEPTRPVFVLGPRFGGKSVLGWSLAQHPNLIHTSGNEWVNRFAIDLYARYDVASRAGRRFKLNALTIDRSEFCRAFGPVLNTFILERVRSELRVGPQATRWVDTTNGTATAAAGLLLLFPDARFIHVVRDAAAVVRSLTTVRRSDGSTPTEEEAYKEWLTVTQECLDLESALGAEVVHRVSFEPLTMSPEETLRELFSFLGEEFCSAAVRPVRAATGHPVSSSVPPTDLRVDGVEIQATVLSSVLASAHPVPPFALPDAAQRVHDRFLSATREVGLTPMDSSLAARVQRAVAAVTPAGATIAVVSKGDEELVRFTGRRGWHFPQAPGGLYAGYHPGTSEEAIEQLDDMFVAGASFLVVPEPSNWWLRHYRGLTSYLTSRLRLVFFDATTCVIFARRDGSFTGEEFVGSFYVPAHGDRPTETSA